MSGIRPSLAALPTSVLLGAVGWWVSGVWLDRITGTLARASVELSTTQPDTISQMHMGVAAALGATPFVALLVRAAISRLSGRAARLREWAQTTFWLVLGSQVGLGGALFATARVALPAALDASVATNGVHIDVAEIAPGNWALAGVAGAAVITTSIGLVSAGLERDGTAPEPMSHPSDP